MTRRRISDLDRGELWLIPDWIIVIAVTFILVAAFYRTELPLHTVDQCAINDPVVHAHLDCPDNTPRLVRAEH